MKGEIFIYFEDGSLKAKRFKDNNGKLDKIH